MEETSCLIPHDGKTPKTKQENVHKIDVDSAIDSLTVGPFQRRILIGTGLCFMSDSVGVMCLSFLCPILERRWALSPNQTATIFSSVFLGATLGALILGRTADLYGRRITYLIAASLIALFGALTAVANSYWLLLMLRTLVGFGGGGLTVVFDILAEYLPTTHRGRYLLYIEYFWAIGTLSVSIIAMSVLQSSDGWRLFVFLLSLPCFVGAFYGAIYIPESPRWLISQGRTDEALNILRNGAKLNGLDVDGVFPQGTVVVLSATNDVEQEASFLDLLKTKWRKLTMLICGLWFGYAVGYYGTVFVITRVFKTDSPSDDSGLNFDFQAIFISSSAEIIGLFLVTFAIDQFGRVKTQVTSYLLGGICLFAFCWNHATWHRVALIVISFLCRIFEIAGTCVTWISTAEILPTEIRTTGHGASNAMAKFGAFCSPYLLAGSMSLRVAGGVMLFIHVATALCSWGLPETNGLGLEEFRANMEITRTATRRRAEGNEERESGYSLVQKMKGLFYKGPE